MRERSSVVTSLSHPCTEEIFAPMILLTHAYYTTPAELCNALLKWYKLREREREREEREREREEIDRESLDCLRI